MLTERESQLSAGTPRRVPNTLLSQLLEEFKLFWWERDPICYQLGVLDKKAMECNAYCALCLNTELCSRDECFVPNKGNYSLHSAGYMQSLCVSYTLAGRLLIPCLPLCYTVKLTPNSRHRSCRSCCNCKLLSLNWPCVSNKR